MAENTEVSQVSKQMEGLSVEGNKQLFVGSLKPGTSEQELNDFFSDHKFSVIHTSIKVSSKDLTNVFGNVKFGTAAEAQKALETLNGTDFKGNKIQLMTWSPATVLKSKETANLYIKDLDQSITQKDLKEKFSVFGTILSVKLETFQDGMSKGFGYVQFEDVNCATKAIEELNNTDWNGKVITVCHFKKKGEREERKLVKNNLYVRNFPASFTEEDLKELFSKHGPITSLMIKPHQDGKKQAFICFETGEQAQNAIQALNGTLVGDCTEGLYVTELISKHEREEQNAQHYKKLKTQNMYKSLAQNLYVNGIPKDQTEEDIRKEFEKFGPVSSIRMHMMPSREDKTKQEFLGAAFVNFENPNDAKTAVYRGNIEFMFGTKILVDYYKPKEITLNEKKEEAGIQMKKFMHDFMMSAMSQARGGSYRGGRGSRGNRGGAPYSSYNSHQMPAPTYLGGAGYSHNAPPMPQNRGYGQATYGNPPLPESTIPNVSMPPVLPVVTGPPPIGNSFPMNPPIAQVTPPTPESSQEIVSVKDISGMSEEETRNFIGEKIYPYIEKHYKEEAPRITGMIIDMDPKELIPSLKSEEDLIVLAKQGFELLKDSTKE